VVEVVFQEVLVLQEPQQILVDLVVEVMVELILQVVVVILLQ
tara:strand:+ start:138 stop:263 length:126 start_codon:yes stop_codon:yes gene_type:complete